MGWDIGGVVNGARNWVGNRLDDAEHAKDWVGEKIEGGIESAEHGIDGFRQDLVAFGEEHGGFVGKSIAQGISDDIGVLEGGTLAVYDMGKGVVQLADGLGKLTNPMEWATHGERNLQRLESAGRAVETLGNLTSPVAWATNPRGNLKTAETLWNGVTAGYQDAAKNGDWSKFAGRAVVDVGSLFIGVGEANAALKGAEGASVVARVGETGEALNVVDKVADGTRVLSEVDKAADAGKLAEGTADAGKVSRADSVLSQAMKDEITAIPKGARPEPSAYLSESYISEHLAQFDEGASRFMPKESLDSWGIAQKDGTSFVMPKSEADAIEAAANRGDLSYVEDALGLKEGFFSEGDLVRVDIPNPRALNLRIPSGNEAGANSFWIPGGKLPGGASEAVVDAGNLADSRYSTHIVNVADGH